MIRTDAYPEQLHYQDTGCSVAPACASCPLERCRYDEPVARSRRQLHARERNALVRELRDHGLTIREISDQAGVGRRSVFRILAGDCTR